MEPPVEYVGGQSDAPRPRAWPYIVLAASLVVLVAGVVLLWNPIRSIGQRAGETIAPYSLALTAASWSSDQKISGVPVSFSLTVDNTDNRTFNGLTLHFVRLDPGWKLLDASSARSGGEIDGTSVYYADVIPRGGSATLSVTLVPSRAMDSVIGFTLIPAHGTTPSRVTLNDGRVITALALTAKVREPTVADADARLTAIYDPQVPVGQTAVWQIHVANTGPITIDGIRLRFVDIPAGFEFRILPTQATVLPDGQTVQYQTTLPPGGQTILLVGVLPQQAGRYQIPVLVFLGQATQALSAANGGPPLSIDLTVN